MKTKLLLAAMLLGGGSELSNLETVLISGDIPLENIFDILQKVGEISMKIFHLLSAL